MNISETQFQAKQDELVAEIKELERHKKELALCLEQANQLIRRYEGIEREQSAELEQLRSERDKMREENERLKQELQDEKDYLRGIIKQTEQDAAREVDKYRP